MKLNKSGLSGSKPPNSQESGLSDFEPIRDRVDRIMGIVDNNQRPIGNMLFFVMYDIESNKVRYQISKYLIKQGCFRIQKSIYLADLPYDTYMIIRADLAEVQACYENEDSILVVPISSDYLHSIKIIGQSIDLDLIMRKNNVLFF